MGVPLPEFDDPDYGGGSESDVIDEEPARKRPALDPSIVAGPLPVPEKTQLPDQHKAAPSSTATSEEAAPPIKYIKETPTVKEETQLTPLAKATRPRSPTVDGSEETPPTPLAKAARPRSPVPPIPIAKAASTVNKAEQVPTGKAATVKNEEPPPGVKPAPVPKPAPVLPFQACRCRG